MTGGRGDRTRASAGQPSAEGAAPGGNGMCRFLLVGRAVSAGLVSAGLESVGLESVGLESVGLESAGPESAGLESAGPESDAGLR